MVDPRHKHSMETRLQTLQIPYWNVLLIVQITGSIRPDNALTPNNRQTSIWTKHGRVTDTYLYMRHPVSYVNHKHIYAVSIFAARYCFRKLKLPATLCLSTSYLETAMHINALAHEICRIDSKSILFRQILQSVNSRWNCSNVNATGPH